MTTINQLPLLSTVSGGDQLAVWSTGNGDTRRLPVSALVEYVDGAIDIGSEQVSFLQAGTGAVERTAQDKMRETVSAKDFGAVGNGVVDDHAAIQAALNSGATAVELTSAVYYCSAGLVVPSGVTLYANSLPSAGAVSSGQQFSGAQLLFANSVATCVTLGTLALGTANISGVTIRRDGASPPTGSVAVKTENQQNATLESLFLYNHDIGVLAFNGLNVWLDKIITGKIGDAHWVLDGTPEFRAVQCRLGVNGTGDLNCAAYIRMKGGTAGSGSGPNTLSVTNCQFNQGGGTVADTFLEIKEITNSTNRAATISFSDCYAENFDNGITTDSSVVSFARLQIANCQFNWTFDLTNPVFLTLDPATVVNEWMIANNIFVGSDFTISSRTINALTMTGNRFVCDVSLTAAAASNSTATLQGNTYLGAGLTLAGATGWQGLSVSDVFQAGAALTNTAGPVKNVTVLSPLQSLGTWTPTLEFGGATTGITYSIQSGTYQLIGNLMFVQFRILLTSKGSATGNATIAGLPATGNAGLFQTGGGGAAVETDALSGLTGPILLRGPQSAESFLRMNQQGAASTTSLTDTNFTNTSQISGSAWYAV